MTSPRKRRLHMMWLLNGQMLLAGIAFWMVTGSLGGLQTTWRHTGRGPVNYALHPSGDGEREEWVDEARYKRHNYTMNGMMLVLGLGLWSLVAWNCRPERGHATGSKE